MSKIPALPPIADKVSPLFIDSHSDVSVPNTEAKLFRLEKITETLLEEIVHLQGELTALRKPHNDELGLIRSQLKRITEKQNQLQGRVANEEQKSLEKDQALTHLLQSTRDLEKKTINNQQLILCRRDVLESQLNHLQSGVNAMQEKWRGYQDHIERQLCDSSERLEKFLESAGRQHREQLVTMKDMKLLIEAQQESLVEEMNLKLGKLHQLLDHTNNKISILGSELLDQCDGQRREVQQWVSNLEEDIKLIVIDFTKKINNCNDITRDYSDQLLHKMESLQQRWHKEHVHQAELVQHCEQQLDRANKSFQVTTKTIQSQTDKRIEAQSKQLRDELSEKLKMVKGQLQREKVKMSQLLAELHKSIDIVQREMEITKEDTNKIIFAEIASRFREFDGIKEQHSKLLEQLDQLRNELINYTSKHCRQEIEQAFHKVTDNVTNKLKLFDHISSQVNVLEKELKSRLSKLSCEHDKLHQDLLVWRKESISSTDDIQTVLSPLAEQLQLMEEQVEMHKRDLSAKMEAEWLERRAKLKELQKQVTYCVTMDTYQQQISSHDQRLLSLEGRVHDVSLHNTQLENSLHKTEMKIVQKVSTETQQRLNSVQQIREQIALLQPHPQIIRRTSSTTPVPATPTSRVRPHRKLHNRYRLKSVLSHDDNNALIQHETQGVFTSAPATPESQQNLIVQNVSHDEPSGQHDQSSNQYDQSVGQHDQPSDQHDRSSDQHDQSSDQLDQPSNQLDQPSNQHDQSLDQHDQSLDQHDQYPLLDEFSSNDPSPDAANEEFSYQRSTDHPSNQHSPEHNSDQHSRNTNQHSLNQRHADQNSPDSIQTDTVHISQTHSSS